MKAGIGNGIVANVYTVQHQAGCTADLKISPQLRLAAQRHAEDLLNNRGLDGDVGSDGSAVADRARATGYRGTVAETIAEYISDNVAAVTRAANVEAFNS